MAPTSLAPTLKQHREDAAQASGGSSDEAIYNAVLRTLNDFRVSGTVLDFGAGTGTLTRRLQKGERFARVISADLMEAPPDLGPDWIRADLNEPLPLPDSYFDGVVAAEVIEHLENPRATAREIFRLLKPGGLAVLSTPNNESFRSLVALMFRGHHVAFLDSSYPAHITALVRKDLSRTFVEAGFDSVEFRFTDAGGLPGMPTISWQRISGGLLRGLRFSDNLLFVARKPGASR